MEEILFEITKDHLEKGMQGFPLGYCTSSYVDIRTGDLFYRGRSITECAQWAPERVLYLLHHGKEGLLDQVESFSSELKERGLCSQAVLRQLKNFPRHAPPMKLLCVGTLLLGMLEGVNSYREDALNVIAKLPHLVASLINHHAGWGETPLPDNSLGYIENFAYMLQAPGLDQEKFSKALTLFNILYYDYGGGGLSTFVGKAVASGLEDIYGSISSALSALSGSKHGKGLLNAALFVEMVVSECSNDFKESTVEEFLMGYFQKNGTLPGFETGSLRAEDMRTRLFCEFATQNFPSHPNVKSALHIRSLGPKIVKNALLNSDIIGGAVLVAAGFERYEYFPLLFAMSRLVGVCTQILYERLEANKGKGVPTMNPSYLYKQSE